MHNCVLVEISWFFAGIGANSPVVILLVFFRYVKVIVIDVIEVLLDIRGLISRGRRSFSTVPDPITVTT
jgi:hypothetical protein